MANRNFSNAGKIYAGHTIPVLVDCNFIVDSTNGNGLGIRSLKGPLVQNVFMHTTVTAGKGNSNPATPNVPVYNPNPQGSSGGGTGSVNLRSAANFAIGAYAAITGSTGAGSVVSGNMFITPNNGSSVTNFPPSTYSGTLDAADSIAVQAMIDATAAYTACQTLGLAGTTLPAELGGTTVTPGNYQSATAFGISLTTGNSTLTLNGAGTYIFYSPSTLITGASGSTDAPVIAFTGGATANNTFIYWICGSSATLNQAVASAGATFYGTVIAQASVTVTQASTVVGRLFALTGAVTLSATVTLNAPAGVSGGGVIVVQLEDTFNRSLSGFHAIVTPVSGTALKVDNSELTAGTAYIITTVGTTTVAAWQTLGVPKGVTPAVGVSFIASSIGAGANSSTSRVMVASLTGSNIMTIETVGDPNLSLAPDLSKNQGFGAQFILQTRDASGAKAAPVDGTVISLSFLLDNGSNKLQGG